METERLELHGVVREGYQILLRAHAELWLPCGHERIAAYYRAVGERCMTWICEIYGERLRQTFADLENIRDRARFPTSQYCFLMRCVYDTPPLAAFLCETELKGNRLPETQTYRRMSQVWHMEEETVLPHKQILMCFLKGTARKKAPFRPDGIYPMGNEVIFYRNSTDKNDFAEWRAQMNKGKVSHKNNRKST